MPLNWYCSPSVWMSLDAVKLRAVDIPEGEMEQQVAAGEHPEFLFEHSARWGPTPLRYSMAVSSGMVVGPCAFAPGRVRGKYNKNCFKWRCSIGFDFPPHGRRQNIFRQKKPARSA
jgi:hypothetical protein